MPEQEKRFKEIIIPNYNEVIEYRPGTDMDDDSVVRDGTFLGTHALCNGMIYAHPISKTHRAFVCDKCGMRIVVPAEVMTVGDFRKHMEPPEAPTKTAKGSGGDSKE